MALKPMLVEVMAINYNIQENGDLIIENGEILPVDEIEDIRLELQCVFNTRLGEFYLDEELGFDFSNIERKGATDEEIMADIMDAINQVDRVTEIEKIEIVRDQGKRVAEFNIEVKAGDLKVREVIKTNAWLE